MKLSRSDYMSEVRRGAPVYIPPLPRKAQRVKARGRSGKVKKFTEEQIFLYKLKKLNQLESF